MVNIFMHTSKNTNVEFEQLYKTIVLTIQVYKVAHSIGIRIFLINFPTFFLHLNVAHF